MAARNASRQSVIVRAGHANNKLTTHAQHKQQQQQVSKYTVSSKKNGEQIDSGYNSDVTDIQQQQWTIGHVTTLTNQIVVDEEGSGNCSQKQIESNLRKHRYKPYYENHSSSSPHESSSRLFTTSSSHSSFSSTVTSVPAPITCENGYVWPPHSSQPQPQSQSQPDVLIECDSDGDTPLHLAVAREDEASVNYITHSMISRRLSIDIRNKKQQTSLHIAVITGNIGVIRCLLCSGACPRLPDRLGNTAVHLAVQCSSLECVQTVLDSSSAIRSLSRRNYNGFTPLHLAIFRKDMKIISQLISKGSDCNCLDGTSGRTPLFHAVSNGNDEIVAALINFGASVNLANYAGVTPLVVATDKRLKNISRLLISKGATMNAKDEA